MKRVALISLLTVVAGGALVPPAHAIMPFNSPPVFIEPWDDNNGETRWGYRALLEDGIAIEVGFLPVFGFEWFTWGTGDPVKFAELKTRIENARAVAIDPCPGWSSWEHFTCHQTTVFKPHLVTSPPDPDEKPVTASGNHRHVSDPLLGSSSCASVFKDRTREVQDAIGEYWGTVVWN